MQNSDNLGRFRENRKAARVRDYGMEKALAKILRRDFGPNNTVDRVAAHFGLTDGEAKGAVYGTASRTTLNKFMTHPRGFGVWLEVLADVTGVTLEQYIENQARGAALERERAEARERHYQSLEARYRASRAEPRSLDG